MRELAYFNVGQGKPVILLDKPGSPIELVKAEICDTLQRLHGNDLAAWQRVLQRLQPRVKTEPAKTAVRELLGQLASVVGEGAVKC